MTKTANHSCIIKNDFEIYYRLQKRIFGDLELKTADVAADAQKAGKKIGAPALHHYWTSFDQKKKKKVDGTRGSLSQENILWLCKRYGIGVKTEIEVLPLNQTPYYKDNLKE